MDESLFLNPLAEALDLCRIAIRYDNKMKYTLAIDYYDKCILQLDDVLSYIPHELSQSLKLVKLRREYEKRMIDLRQIVHNRGRMRVNGRDRGSMSGSKGGSSSTSARARGREGREESEGERE